MISDILSYTFEVVLPQIISFIFNVAPIWLPMLAVIVFWRLWKTYVNAYHIVNRKHVLLEVRLPREQYKSPLAMEIVLNSMHERAGESNWLEKYWKGSTRPWFSLEIISTEGDIKFFFWTQEKFRHLIEHQVYAQYPDVEIVEVEDYTNFLKYDKEKISLFGCEFIPVKKDAYPIKTYVDYGLDKDPKEEYKIDPISPVMEFLGAIGPGERAWYQIMIRFHKKRAIKEGGLWAKLTGETTWQKDAAAEVDKLLQRDPKTKAPKTESVGESSFPVRPVISAGEENAAKAIERSLSKSVFDVGIRGLYIAESDKFKSINIAGLIGAWRQYGSDDLNSIKPTTKLFKFMYPWQDYKNFRKNIIKAELFDAYRRRAYFHWPHLRDPFVMTTEELATIFHFPGSVIKTPSFKRIEAKKTEPPSNLPI